MICGDEKKNYMLVKEVTDLTITEVIHFCAQPSAVSISLVLEILSE